MAATTHTPQHIVALATANERRLRIAEIRRLARRGEITLAQVMADPPADLENWLCVDVVRMVCRARGRHSTSAMVERLGRLALRDEINLLMPLGRTSSRTRTWIAEHAAWNAMSARGGGTGLIHVSRDEDAMSRRDEGGVGV